jgi:hypothetical protein
MACFAFPCCIIPPSEFYNPCRNGLPLTVQESSTGNDFVSLSYSSSSEDTANIDILTKELRNRGEAIHLDNDIFYFREWSPVDSTEKYEIDGIVFDERDKWWNELDIISLLPCTSFKSGLECSSVIDPFLLQRIVSLFIQASPTTTSEDGRSPGGLYGDHISEISKAGSSPSELGEEDDDSSTLSSHSSSDLSSCHKLHHDVSESDLYDDVFKEVASEEGDSEKDGDSKEESQGTAKLIETIKKSSYDVDDNPKNHRFSLSGVEDDIFSPAVENDPPMKLANRIHNLLPLNMKNEEVETEEPKTPMQSDADAAQDYSVSSRPFDNLLIPCIIRSFIFSGSCSQFSYQFITSLLCWIDTSVKLKEQDHGFSEKDTNLHPFSISNGLFPSQKHQLQEFENKRDDPSSIFKRVLFSGKYTTEESGGNERMEEEQRKKKEFILRKRKEFFSKSKLVLSFVFFFYFLSCR